ncbi:MAG: type II toxin-antitoxin system antitoxin DNA ADP-ribosyl glycohydrolase DarG [Dermatophilaceae bacterium]
MSSSTEFGNVRLAAGDLLKSRAQTLVNTVNCVGVMGKGIALGFKRRYPTMYADYVERCRRGEVRVGEPYLYRSHDHLIVNFPTKTHWRAVSRLSDIVAGLEYLAEHSASWGITSLAVPPLGCGNGQLEWGVVGPTLIRYLARLDIPVELYVPYGEPLDMPQLALGDMDFGAAEGSAGERHLDPEWVAVVAVLDRLERQPHHWPVGRIMFQKLVYFAAKSGIPTGLDFEASSYGPFAQGLQRMMGRLQNNGLVAERQRGRMFEVQVGPTYRDAVAEFRTPMEQWREAVDRTADLMSRMNTQTAETAASVHYVAETLYKRFGRSPTASEVVDAVEKWKVRRKPPMTREAILEAMALLARRRWIEVTLDERLRGAIDDLVLA